jgi:hypothetical protein
MTFPVGGAVSGRQNGDDTKQKQNVQATSAATEVPDAAAAAPVDMGPSGPEFRMSSAEAHLEEATRKAKQHSGGLKVFSGNGNMALALEIARHLGINLGKSTVGRFADGEVNVVIHENVRGKDVYVVQPTGPPVNDNIMELLLMVSTLRRASARRITVVIVSKELMGVRLLSLDGVANVGYLLLSNHSPTMDTLDRIEKCRYVCGKPQLRPLNRT